MDASKLRAALGRGGLYTEKAPPPQRRPGADSDRHARELLQTVRAAVAHPSPVAARQPTLRRLLDPATMQRALFIGASQEMLAALPKSLPVSTAARGALTVLAYASACHPASQELLQWEELERELLDSAAPSETLARSVLAGVKAKGAAMGEQMDAGTEQQLWPVVLAESFAQQLEPLMQRRFARLAAELALSHMPLASPAAAAARWGQLSAATLRALAVAGVAVQDGFLEPEWVELVATDLRRMAAEDRAAAPAARRFAPAVPAAAETCELVAWPDVAQDEQRFPALAEALKRLMGLPFELNARMGSALRVPMQRVASVGHFPAADGCSRQVRARRDNPGGSADNGRALTAILHLTAGCPAGAGGELVVRSGGREARVQAAPGRLVLLRCRQAEYSVEPVRGWERFVLYLSMYGPELPVSDGGGGDASRHSGRDDSGGGRAE